MRILLVLHYLPPHEGGIERVVARLADGYAQRGWEPVIAGWGPGPPGGPHRCVSLPGINPLEARLGVPVPLLDPLRAWRILRREVAAADAVHIHGLPYVGSMLALAVTRRSGTPTVVTEHVGTVPYDRRILRVVQAAALAGGVSLARRARAVTVLNDRVGAELGPRLEPVPVHKVPNGVDTQRFSPAGSEERAQLRRRFGFDGPTVVSVGRNVAKKGMRRVVGAAAHGDFDVLIVGRDSGPLANPPRIRVVESMAQHDLADVYRAADALVLASEGEGLPLVVQEALASGLPVVMGDDPAVRAELPEGPVRFVDVRDEAALAAAIGDVVARREELAVAARTACVERFDWDRTVARFEDLLRLPVAR